MLADIRSIQSFEDLKLLYFKYKDTAGFTLGVVVVFILLSIVILLYIAMPQADKWFSIRREVADTKNRIELLKSNQSQISAMDQGVLDRQFLLTNEALPYEKNYSGIVTLIDDATLKSGMRREDYSFSVGNLSTKSAQLAPNTAIPVKITLAGDINQLLTFIQTMQKSFPLSEIVLVSYHSGRVNTEINFFYKYKPENFQIPYTDPLRKLTDKNIKKLQVLDVWEKEANSASR